jgi:hypothetical protein
VATGSEPGGHALKAVVVNSAVLNYSQVFQGDLIMPSTFRQTYRPKPDRAPIWLRRIWFWL